MIQKITQAELDRQQEYVRAFPSLPDRPMTYHIVTYGCQMNVHDSEKLAGILESMGMRLYDHIVISGSRDYSFHAHHLLDGMGETPAQPLREPDDLAADRPLRVLPAREERT